MYSPDEVQKKRATLSAAQRVALEQRLRGTSAGVLAQRIPRRAVSESVPLSFAQQRLWYLEQLEPGNSAYHTPIALRLTGQLARAALEQSLRAIIQRHEVLRTTFAVVDTQPVQRIGPALPLGLPVVDLTQLPPVERAAAARQRMVELVQQPFDLQTGPLLHATVLQLGPDEQILLLSLHHIITDGWSIGVLVREVATLYAAYVAGRWSDGLLPELPIQYADYAVWQRGWLQGESLAAQVAYWQRQLADIPAVLNLPTDHPRPAVQTFRGAAQSLQLSRDLSTGLKALSQQEGCTLFATMLAGFAVLLQRSSGQDDIVVGTDIANRTRVETEGLIGFFVNQLVLRTRLAGDPPFRDVLRQVREVVLDAYAHQDVPFEKLVEVLRPRRSLSYTPLFQVKIVFQNAPLPPLHLPGLTVSPLSAADGGPDTSSGGAKFDLTLFVKETEQGITAVLEYNTDLFAATTITHLLQRFETLLSSAVAQPDTRISRLTMQTITERRQHAMEHQERKAANLKKFMSIQPKAFTATEQRVIKSSTLQPDQSLPLVIEPAVEGVDLVSWSQQHQAFVRDALSKHGAVLFRGFNNMASVAGFEQFALTVCKELFKENGEHTPVSHNGNVQTPVFYPADQKLLWHNENSFNNTWPNTIVFGCLQPAQQGGETPLVDSRKVFELIDPVIREEFQHKQIMYQRNYGDGLGLSWQKVFQTTDKAAAEAFCRQNLIDFEWKDGDRLRTYQVRPAVIKHPLTGELSWFNQAQHWHISCLDPATRESLMALFREEDLPRNCYYGDGSSISAAAMNSILAAYRSLEVSFPWQKGDVIVVDNVLTAHARNPFVGERKILVALGDLTSYAEL